MTQPRFIDYEVTVTLNVTTAADDLRDALARSGIVVGSLIGEAMIEDVTHYPEVGEDDDEEA